MTALLVKHRPLTDEQRTEVESHFDYATSTARTLGRKYRVDEDTATSVALDALLEAVHSRPEDVKLCCQFRRVFVNRLKNEKRRRRFVSLDALTREPGYTDTGHEDRETVDRVWSAFMNTTERNRSILTALRDGESQETVGERFALSQARVQQILANAIQRGKDAAE
jgi:DNA-directed RNA polymerase specialized sigma24 family protein